MFPTGNEKYGLMGDISQYKPPEEAFNPTPWGFVQNVAKGLGGIITGLGTLVIGAPAHDLTQLAAAYLVPGTQRIEDEPSSLASIARTMLPGAWFPGEDLGGPKGAVAGDIAQRYGGASNIVHGLYENPLAYVMDVLTVATGVGAVGKVGRVGALSKLPPIVSDTAAARILGPALKIDDTLAGAARYSTTGRYGARYFGSMTAGGLEPLKVSTNPVARGVQNLIYNKLATITPEQAGGYPMAGGGALPGLPQVAFQRAQAAIDAANAQGLRVLRPGLSNFLVGHESTRIISARRVLTSTRLKGAAEEINRAAYGDSMPGKVYDPITDTTRALDAEAASEYARGTATPLVLPRTDPFNMGSTWTMLDAAPETGAFSVDDAAAINRLLGRKSAQGTIPIVAPESPYAGSGGNVGGGMSGKARYQMAVESLDQADQVAADGLRALGAEPMGVFDTFQNGADPWDARAYFGVKPDGTVVEINVGTPDLLYQQGQAAHHISRLKVLQNDIGEAMLKLADMADEDEARILANKIDVMQRELSAGFEYTRGLFDDTRAQYWSEHGGPAYSPELKAAWRMRAVEDKLFTQDWMKKAGGETPYTTMMERAYQPLRATRLYESMSRVRTGVEEVMRRPRQRREIPDDGVSIVRNPDGTVTLRGWHGTMKKRGIPEPGAELSYGGFHFGTKEAAETRLWAHATDGRYGEDAAAVIPLEFNGKVFGVDSPLSELDNAVIEAGSVEEALLAKVITPDQVDELSPALAELADADPAADLVAGMKAQGYDGWAYLNDVEDPGSLSVGLFDTSKARRLDKNVPPAVHEHQQLLDIIHLMEREIPNLPESARDLLLDDILGKRPLMGSLQDPSKAALRLTQRFRDNLWDYTVVEGGHGRGLGFDEYDWATMHAARRESGMPTANYVPDLPRGNPSSYFRKGGKISTNDVPAAYSKKSLGLLYETGRAEMDLLKAVQRKAQITIEHQESAQLTLNMINKYGRVITEQEAMLLKEYGVDTGEVFVSPEMIRSHFTLRGKLLANQLDNYILNDDLPLGRGRLQEATLQAIDTWAEDVLEEGLNGLGRGKMMAIPKSVARKLEQENSMRFGHAMKMFWDTPMSLWKASVLSLSPRWVINNFFGNMIFMGIENPGALRGAIRGLDVKQRRLVASVFGEDNLALDEMGFYNSMTDFGGATAEQFTRAGRVGRLQQGARGAIVGDRELAGGGRVAGAAALPIGMVKTVSGGVKRINSIVEQGARRGVFVDEVAKRNLHGWVSMWHKTQTTLKKIAEEGVDEASMRAALEGVDRALGNFMRYSPIEQNIIRRYFMPFYGFYRHMTNVLLKFPIEHPLKATVARLVGEFNESFLAGMPEYMQDQIPVHVGSYGGQDFVLRLKNMNPLSLINDDYPIIGVLNPALKVVLERGLGISTFTGEDFPMPENGSMVQTSEGRYWNVQRDAAGNVLGVESTGKPLPSIMAHLGGQFGPMGMIPGFQLYPKSFLLNLAGFAGVPMTVPKRSLAASAQFDQEMEAQAIAAAQPDPFEDVFVDPFGGQ